MAKYPGSVLGTFKAKVVGGRPNWLITPLKTREEILYDKGLRYFQVNGKKILALNMKNAIRKSKIVFS